MVIFNIGLNIMDEINLKQIITEFPDCVSNGAKLKARNHFKKETNATFIDGDFLNYDFTKMYDVICSTLTFMHIQDKEYALTKIFSLLKQDGKAVLSIDKNQQTYINTGYSRITIFPDTPNTICGLLRQIGFSNIEVEEIEFAHIISCIKN